MDDCDRQQARAAAAACSRVDQVVDLATIHLPMADPHGRRRASDVGQTQDEQRFKAAARVLHADAPSFAARADTGELAVTTGVDHDAAPTALEHLRRPTYGEALADAAEVDRTPVEVDSEVVTPLLPPRPPHPRPLDGSNSLVGPA
jgi:hypothetical protein